MDTDKFGNQEQPGFHDGLPFGELEASEESDQNEYGTGDQGEDDQLEFDGEVKVVTTAFDDRTEVIVIETVCCCHCKPRKRLTSKDIARGAFLIATYRKIRIPAA